MDRATWIAGLLALILFGYAQYHGWSLFDRDAAAQTSRVSGSNARLYHK